MAPHQPHSHPSRSRLQGLQERLHVPPAPLVVLAHGVILAVVHLDVRPATPLPRPGAGRLRREGLVLRADQHQQWRPNLGRLVDRSRSNVS